MIWYGLGFLCINMGWYNVKFGTSNPLINFLVAPALLSLAAFYFSYFHILNTYQKIKDWIEYKLFWRQIPKEEKEKLDNYIREVAKEMEAEKDIRNEQSSNNNSNGV